MMHPSDVDVNPPDFSAYSEADRLDSTHSRNTSAASSLVLRTFPKPCPCRRPLGARKRFSVPSVIVNLFFCLLLLAFPCLLFEYVEFANQMLEESMIPVPPSLSCGGDPVDKLSVCREASAWADIVTPQSSSLLCSESSIFSLFLSVSLSLYWSALM